MKPGEQEVWSYRAHLDGLRAVAVYLVVAFHAGADRLGGGFVGVDVFFVLSGYLVTHLLVRDLLAQGRVRLGTFYARRARRLLPAAALCLVASAVVFTAIAAPVELSAAERSVRAASLYFANWFSISESADYFGSDLENSPVAHFWSLSVEEQFYLLWPLLLTAVFMAAAAAGHRRMQVVRAVVAAAAVVSVVAALRIAETDLNRAYYGTDTRAYQLLGGALVALTPGFVALARRLPGAARALPAASLGLVGGICVLSTSLVDVGPITRGVGATVLTCAVLVCLEAVPGGIGRRVLSLPPLVFLGKVSYGTYLWHWIVILVATRELELGPVATFALTVPVATGLAALSFELVERPVRTAPVLDRLRGPVIAAGLAVSVLIGLVAVPAVLDRGARRTEVAAGEVAADVGGTPNTADWGAAFLDFYDIDRNCPSGVGRACEVVRGDAGTVLLIGDSHAGMLLPMLREVAARHELSLYGGLLPFCPWDHGMKYGVVGPECFRHQDQVYGPIMDAVDPDIVVLAHRTVDDPQNPMAVVDREVGAVGANRRRKAEVVARRARETVAALRAEGRTVVVIEPVPVAPREKNPLACLSRSEYLEPCRFVATVSPTPEEVASREADEADDGVLSLDLDPLVCPYLPICDPVVGGRVVRRDDTHLTTTFARSLAGPVSRLLVDSGVVDRSRR